MVPILNRNLIQRNPLPRGCFIFKGFVPGSSRGVLLHTVLMREHSKCPPEFPRGFLSINCSTSQNPSVGKRVGWEISKLMNCSPKSRDKRRGRLRLIQCQQKMPKFMDRCCRVARVAVMAVLVSVVAPQFLDNSASVSSAPVLVVQRQGPEMRIQYMNLDGQCLIHLLLSCILASMYTCT